MMNTANTSTAARTAYVQAAFQAAAEHNVLTVEDRAAFAASLAVADLVDAECWAGLVVYDLSERCRSFTPPVLTNLVELGRACGAHGDLTQE